MRLAERRIFQSEPQTCINYLFAYSTIFHYILNSTLIKQFSVDIYFITPVTIFLNNFIHNGKITSFSTFHCTARDTSGTPMPDENSGMGKTNENASLIRKKSIP
jgi:sRNA-binding regulator protein Hfq